MRLYTPAQTAIKLGVSTKTLMRWRASGKFIPEVETAGGHSRYSEDQINMAKEGVFNAVDGLLS